MTKNLAVRHRKHSHHHGLSNAGDSHPYFWLTLPKPKKIPEKQFVCLSQTKPDTKLEAVLGMTHGV